MLAALYGRPGLLASSSNHKQDGCGTRWTSAEFFGVGFITQVKHRVSLTGGMYLTVSSSSERFGSQATCTRYPHISYRNNMASCVPILKKTKQPTYPAWSATVPSSFLMRFTAPSSISTATVAGGLGGPCCLLSPALPGPPGVQAIKPGSSFWLGLQSAEPLWWRTRGLQHTALI